jgi:leucyl-tRNA synthetase
MPDRYEPSTFESEWRQRWKDADLFKTREAAGAPKFYGLDFFPYPSGAGLSVGHCRNYVPTDVICRMKIMQGFNVLHPMGFDAFGLPAENEAIKRKVHPAAMIKGYAATYHRQMDLIGVSYDWSRSFSSSDPSYYKWTQWIFELLYKRGLAYQKLAAVNWDPVDKTVLADEEVVGGRGERSGALVEKKYIPQWFLKITDYAQRLIDDLDTIDWPEGIKLQQRNWIGRSEGVQFRIQVQGTGAGTKTGGDRYDLDSAEVGISSEPLSFEVFTTRIDTVFGMTFCVLAPELRLVDRLLQHVAPQNRDDVEAYRLAARTLSDVDRTSTTREKTGVFTGAYAINPANGDAVQIWVADYVLATYGTGAIMAVPAHDERDFEFATKFGIPIRQVIAPDAIGSTVVLPFVSKDGYLVNSGEYSGLSVAESQAGLGTWMEGLEIGQRKIQYRLRDWLISRQRYWGCPIPVIHTADGEDQLVPEDCLPVELPVVDRYEPSGDGSSPLAHIPEFVNTTDLDGRMGKRETDTMGGFACSSWYFLRFTDPFNFNLPWSPEAAEYWMPVDCYVGGSEHAVMHLLYARFWTKVLYDAGLIKVVEPFQRLQNQGQVLALTPYRKTHEHETLNVGEDGILISFEEAATLAKEDITYRWARMSKSKGNVVTPEEAVASYGADALRLYLLFRAPFEADIEWENKGMSDLGRFLTRVFRYVDTQKPHYVPNWRDLLPFEELDDRSRKIRRATHQAIRIATTDIDRFAFNTYVSGMMKFLNALNELSTADPDRAYVLSVSEAIDSLVLLLSPGAPHSADELWNQLGHTAPEGKWEFTLDVRWPEFSADLAAEDTVTIAVQVNGKLRDTFPLAAGAPQSEHESAALALPKVKQYIDGCAILKVVVVPGKLVNIVVR